MTLEDKIDNYILARWSYAVGKPIMSDMEYNELHSQLLNEVPDNEYVKRVWSEDPCPVMLLDRLGRNDLYRDISITYGSESMSSLRTDEEVEYMFRGLNIQTRVSYKVDGWNNQINYYNGHIISGNTRGRATTPKDSNVTLSVLPQRIPLKGKVKVIGEASIPNKKWEEFKVLYGGSDQRASMSTVIAKHLTEYVSFKAFNIISPDNDLQTDKYSLLNQLGFETPKFVNVKDYAGLKSAIKMLSIMDSKNDVLTDGLVVENSSIQIALRVGKWQESDIYSYVTGYGENTTPYGISMTLKIYPVKVGGKNISILDVTNISQIVKNNLRIGNPIAFAIRSGANPAINMTRTAQLQEENSDYEAFRKAIVREQSLLK